jgi:hypothetical protein
MSRDPQRGVADPCASGSRAAAPMFGELMIQLHDPRPHLLAEHFG